MEPTEGASLKVNKTLILIDKDKGNRDNIQLSLILNDQIQFDIKMVE
jgi:hypothetical protein